MRVGVDVVQADPRAEAAEVPREIGDVGAGGPGPPRAGCRHRRRRCPGTDDQQFFDAGLDQPFGLADDRMGGAGGEFAAHVGDDAEPALVVTALGDLEVAVVARGEGDAAGGQQVDERVGRGRHGGVDGVQHVPRTGAGQ